MNNNLKRLLGAILILVVGALAGVGVTVTLKPTEVVETQQITVEDNSTVQLPEAIMVENEAGELEVKEAPLVDEVDGGEIPTALEEMNDEEREAAAQGFAIDITTPWTVVASLVNQCIYLNNPFGSQCVNTSNVIAENQVGYWFSTCGTGAARGIWDCAEYNARGGYELITDPTQLRPGDIFVTWGGEWGHTGMVIGYYSDGYIPVFSTNQGGIPCAGGGSTANTINLSMATFSGAFRWHGWDYLFEAPEPEPTPVSENQCEIRKVQAGDTLGKIMLECRGEIKWGEDMNEYARHWYSTAFQTYLTVFDGWASTNGVGLFAGDTIEYRAE